MSDETEYYETDIESLHQHVKIATGLINPIGKPISDQTRGHNMTRRAELAEALIRDVQYVEAEFEGVNSEHATYLLNCIRDLLGERKSK